MELRHLRYFNTVVGAGSLTAAAAQLHMSQPPLSVAIAQLESDLGVTLLTRTPRGVEPTSAGQFLLEASTRLLGELDDMVAALGRFGSGLAGSLSLAAVPQLMWHKVPQLLRAVRVEAPDLEIQLLDPPPWTALDLLEQRKVDLAAVVVADHRRFRARHRGSLEFTDWGQVPLVAALPPELEDAADPLPLQAFEGRLLLVPQGSAAVPSVPETVFDTLRRHGVVPASVRTVETIQAGLPLIESGLAWAILPDPDHASLGRFALTVRNLDPAPRPLRALVCARSVAAADARSARVLRLVSESARD